MLPTVIDRLCGPQQAAAKVALGLGVWPASGRERLEALTSLAQEWHTSHTLSGRTRLGNASLWEQPTPRKVKGEHS